ncbi:Glucosamine-6-phosphate deaminase [Candidatus Rhodobacter oscarellae]|uniref:Glucosamine-6-phosphate deaminase n=1 Tax=Candidatus Rhodobacter oscarellae TaxID=1675527 RepID=A0A0J9ECH3_9RHOB|nr:SIS domain-containing protein [Candidatus Rhodobacter lobularis]KMW60477.1 Glucosamine-6-phosphate deaminase [Candidatus Rhodobacter lobularis]
MRQEINEIPEAVARLLDQSAADIAECGKALRERDPAFVATIARGSSDHACLFLKYAIELTSGHAVASLGPSVASVYGVTPRLAKAAVLGLSQSGRSPDLVSSLAAAHAAGALTVAVTNNAGSPLWQQAEHGIDMQAGPELAVAATKSFVCSAVAGLALLAQWQEDQALQSALAGLPDKLSEALALSWDPLGDALSDATSLYVLGRGPGVAMACEAALKFKETCGLHAEAYSAAEAMHGPLALAGRGLPVLIMASPDAAQQSIRQTAEAMSARGSDVFVTSGGIAGTTQLDRVETGATLTDALSLIVPFYGFVEAMSRQRGLDPDNPEALKKVTETM